MCHILVIPQERMNIIIKYLWIISCIKTKLMEKLVILMHPKFLSWIQLILLVAHFLCHPKKMAKLSGSIFFKWFIIMKQSYQSTLVMSSSYVLLMMINMNKLCHTIILSITLQTKRMIILPCHRCSLCWWEKFITTEGMETIPIDIKLSKEATPSSKTV